MMHSYRTALSRDGVRLHLAEAGTIAAPGIIFIHGTGSSHRIWQQQFSSAALQQFHLVAYDLRGHGQSDRPLSDNSYQQGQLWADDLAAVIAATKIKQPVVVAWSYGGRTVCDYLRFYQGSQLKGINFIAAGTLAIPEAQGPCYPILQQIANPDLVSRQQAEQQFFAALQHPQAPESALTELLAQDLRQLALNTRLAMRQRQLDYDEELAQLTLPVLLSHGLADQLVLPVLTERLKQKLPKAHLDWYSNSGHLPFWHEAKRYNRQLAAFVSQCHAE